MEKRRYINVILPLKLGWEPFYVCPEGVCPKVGDRALVPFAGKSYLAVVSEVDSEPDPMIKNIIEIYGLQEHKDKIMPEEIRFWRQIASYYMCTVGEVYKAAYPSVKDETVRAKKKDNVIVPPADAVPGIGEQTLALADKCQESMDKAPVLLSAANSDDVMLELCLRAAKRGENVLWLVPEVKLSKALEARVREALGSRLIVWGSNITPAKKRDAAKAVRSGNPYVILGTRSSLFLPHNHLGLVMVHEEQEISYKQTSPAPRYNGRDAAIILALQHGAKVLLQSSSPSLESRLNAFNGKYLIVEGEDLRRAVEWIIVDTRAELLKNGMRGELSYKMIDACAEGPCAFYKPMRAAFPKMDVLCRELSDAFGDVFVTDDLVGNPIAQGTRTLCVFGCDSLLGRNDFRADERLMHSVMQAAAQCGSPLRRVVIQTREASHPVFDVIRGGDASPLIAERREFMYPPFSRMIDVAMRDDSPARLSLMSRELCKALAPVAANVLPVPGVGVRVMLPKDKTLAARKADLMCAVEEFEKARKYAGHIYFDVDPQ